MQVIENLIVNARQFSPTDAQIQVDLYGIGTTAFLRVLNKGELIPEKYILHGHIFEPFFTSYKHGRGLGLTVVKVIVDKHGGSVFVDSFLIGDDSEKSRLYKIARTIFTVALPMVNNRKSKTEIISQ